MDPGKAYQWLDNHSRETAYLASTRSLLSWDQRTYIPRKGHVHRAHQLANLAKFLHIRMTDPGIGEMLSVVEESEWVKDPSRVEAVNVREWRRSFDRTTRIPQRLAVELAQAAAAGESCWETARPQNNWATFKPYLVRLVDLKREEAEALGYAEEAYDALLEDYEPGETARNLEPVFTPLRQALVQLLDKIKGSPRKPDTSVLRRHYPRLSQEAFAQTVVTQIGYDSDAGRMDSTAHPFTVGIGPGDVRITTRYDEHFFNMGLFGALHEAGHAIYDQGLLTEHWGTPMGESVSLGVHESQSRLWENIVGRSLSFWECFYPKARNVFTALRDVPLETFHAAINNVHPDLIRTEADEVTYNLHIMLRFELEVALMRGRIEVDDLPELWNKRMQEYLGVMPPDYGSGVMQDIHWSGGAIGYFPTYTLGNLYAAQFFARARHDLGDLDAQFRHGDFAPFLQWLRKQIHTHGKRYRPRDLLLQVTGEDLNSGYLVGYLEEKYKDLYRL